MKSKAQNFKFNELKRRIFSFIKSEPACLHTFCNNVRVHDIFEYVYKGVICDL